MSRSRHFVKRAKGKSNLARGVARRFVHRNHHGEYSTVAVKEQLLDLAERIAIPVDDYPM
jgi:hypothetical protein